MLYALTWQFDLHLPAYPNGFWSFNPFAWQLLFVFGAWCALGGAKRMSRILSSPVTLWICVAYLLFAFCVTLTWYVPQLSHLMPRRVEQWMYPIDKTDLDVLRFAHFLALAALTVRFLPRDWPGLKSPWLRPLILCGQHSLEIFCLGVFLAFAGHFVLAEVSGGAGTAFRCQYLRNPHHVRRGVGDFVVQTLADKSGIANKMRRRQRRSGGRRRMSVRLGLSGPALLAGLVGRGASRAPRMPPAELRRSGLSADQRQPAARVAEAVKSGQPLNILVVGSRSSTIPAAEGSAYPARLQVALKEKLPRYRGQRIRRTTDPENRRGSGARPR